MAKKKDKLENEGWVSWTEAAILLKVRYLKVRDLASAGHLGEVKRSDTGRYFVRRDAVMKYKAELDTKKAPI